MEEIKKIREEIMNLIKDKELTYIEDDNVYNQILGKYTSLNQKYIQLYYANHKKFYSDIREIKQKLSSDSAWNLILEFSNSDKGLKQIFNKLYSINKISTQNKKVCENSKVLLINDVDHYGECQKCKKKISQLKEQILFDSEMAKEDLNNTIIEKMKNDIQTSTISLGLLEKYKKSIETSSNKIKALLEFSKSLKKDEQKELISLIKKLYSGREVELLNINLVITSLKTKKDKYKGITNFINSLKKEISEFQNKVPDSKKKEWIFQL